MRWTLWNLCNKKNWFVLWLLPKASFGKTYFWNTWRGEETVQMWHLWPKFFLKRAIWQNTLLLSRILTNHSNVIFVTTLVVLQKGWSEKKHWLVRFMKVRNLSHVIYLCNQSYSQKENLRRHISAIHWKVRFISFMNWFHVF
jgi:hypothetical protein